MDTRDKVVLAGLWHDIGKIVRRSGVSGEHSYVGSQFLKDCDYDADIVRACRYHHGKFLKNANLKNDDIAYITYIADNISSSADRRFIEGEEESYYGFNEHVCLKSVFNILNGNNSNLGYSDANTKNINELILPDKIANLNTVTYDKLLTKVKEIIKCKDYSINSILELLESAMSYIPSCTAQNDLNDISLYDHCRLTGGISACLYEYLLDKGVTDYKTTLLKEEKQFMNEKSFVLASFDISGIQKFIYSIPSQDALKQLRARSAYLDIISENLVDDILDEMGFSKANLIYNGGGHCYMVLPNTTQHKSKFFDIINKQNEWLLSNFRESLYIAGACVECSANVLCNKGEDGNLSNENNFGNLFNLLQQEISKNKLKRYSASQINLLNMHTFGSERECNVCGNSAFEVDSNGRCHMCNALTSAGQKIVLKDSFFVFTKNKIDGFSNLAFYSYKYGSVYMQVIEESEKKDIFKLIEENQVVRIYGKNSFNVGVKYYGKIYIGEYYAMNGNKPMSFDEFEASSKGINRLAVFRADVDNLGLTFKNGFSNNGDYKYETLSRFATLSRMLSRFFKLHINEIFNDKYAKYSTINLFSSNRENRKIAIIYSGGDDLCLVGSYDDVIKSAIDLKNMFKKYCNDTMTMSGGIGLYNSGYPISRMAVEVGELEEVSKGCPDKNSITLFDSTDDYTFSWDDFENCVINEKLIAIENYFKVKSIGQVAGGVSFIYKLLEFLRNNDRAKIAYILSRLLDNENNMMDREFTNKAYNWSRDKKDRKELITAFTLYVYSIRED
ncbi:MAG: type III-A CRISPR-associated protein Cas10/Csm1 [Clostridia bacterium]|nr:type III-A CRISPR-associated protein Cas10/Csm1 [Clostridia bacterium]